MTRGERVARAVFDAVEELNAQLPPAERLSKSRETPLLGPGARLDSLGLVNLIAVTQRRIEETFGARLTLADGEFLAGATEAASSLGGFIDVIEKMLDKRGHG